MELWWELRVDLGSAGSGSIDEQERMAVIVALGAFLMTLVGGFNTYTLTSLYGNTRRKAMAMLLADAAARVAGAAG
ncbi:hypothetical protein [Streptomyces sp. E11-3]|uniref:hypothetical protein n=1 Tax=Streptomyces sp. E11-3 TaxID=3110112 RepID=UPI00397EB9DD